MGGSQLQIDGRWRTLDLSNPADWSFVNGDWSQDDAGVMTRPKVVTDENIAVYTAEHYGDFEAEFEFRYTAVCNGGGVIFRGRDAKHYYLIEFPCTGQQYRMEYFWVYISRVDERGWTKVLHTQWMSGVPSEINYWHAARLLVKGDAIHLWVDGRPLPVIHDSLYNQNGHFGLYCYDGLGKETAFDFRNVRIRGANTRGSVWDDNVEPPCNWYYPTTDDTYGRVHMFGGFVKTPGGDLLMKISAGTEFHGAQDTFTPVMIRSSDNGRTWSAMQKLAGDARGAPFCTRSGELMMIGFHHEPPFAITRRVSADDGHTWSDPEACGNVTFDMQVDSAHANHLIELADGTLLWSMYIHSPNPLEERQGNDGGSYCMRSTDGGRTWSQAVYMDGPRPEGRWGMVRKHFGSETQMAQRPDGEILALVRTYFDPMMWETWSSDGGQTWTPAARGPFGMWASTCAMTCTQSGAILAAGRHPGMSFQLTTDGGMSWDCYRFDTTFWANGQTLEIEPNLVMFASTGKYGDPRVRVHLFEITPDGPQPVVYS